MLLNFKEIVNLLRYKIDGGGGGGEEGDVGVT